MQPFAGVDDVVLTAPPGLELPPGGKTSLDLAAEAMALHRHNVKIALENECMALMNAYIRQMQWTQPWAYPSMYAKVGDVHEAAEGNPVSRASTTASLGENSTSGSEDNDGDQKQLQVNSDGEQKQAEVEHSHGGNRPRACKEVRQLQALPIEDMGKKSGLLISWPVDASKFTGSNRQIVSPGFEIATGVTCRLMIKPKEVGDHKGQAGFGKAKGYGSIQLKCEADSSTDVPPMTFSLTIGAEGSWQPKRGPVSFSFADGSVCGLPPSQAVWDFRAAVDKASSVCTVRMELSYD